MKIKEIVDLLITLIKNMSVIIVLAYIITRSRYFSEVLKGRLDIKNRLSLVIIFGLFSIYGTLSGMQLIGGIANIRDLGPMIAGLLGGPLAGLGAGLIGAGHRYSLGGLSAVPCAVSTIVAGLSGGVIFYLRRGRLPGVYFAMLFGAGIEVLHMLLTLLLARPYAEALILVKQVALPMIFANAAGLGIFIFIVLNLVRERETETVKKRIEGELQVARQIQLSIVPKIFPPFPNRDQFDIHAILEPAKEVGGDLYDFFFLNDDKLCFVIGDVSGKGVPASLFMAVTKTLLKASSHEGIEPDQILARVNNELCADNDSGMFVTAFLGIIHIPSGQVACSNAGHNLPFILRRDGSLEKLPRTPGMALGVMEDIPYGPHGFRVGPGDTILLYTDGITEAMNRQGEMFGDRRLENILSGCVESSASEITARVKDAVFAFADGAEQSDDITVLALKNIYRGKLRLTIKNRLEEITRLAKEIERFVESRLLPGKLAFQLNLAVEEIVTNSIKYGYDDQGEHQIELVLETKEGAVLVTVIDDGRQFNPLEAPEADTSLSAEDRPVGGLGIHLVRQIMEDVEYRRENSRNILTMKKIIE